ncbi:TAF4 domain-containing protein [Mycena indigotica]|uniref:Transcription initiation factor TFIID subunit 4 n=1 Tax=Mycena indigotica TaxID=2126181 RepID=A0A8H6TEN6_9AGAR|nr:TAF4 domain-containing protein [Mycena indigotica]KAF7316328.1 TAF4 domain-containing protein [Mycena indigotica]
MAMPVISAADLDALIPLDPETPDTPSTSTAPTTTPIASATSSQSAAAVAAAYQQYQQYHQYYTASYGTQLPAATSQPQSMARQAITNAAAAAGSSALDTSDVATLNDALGSAGVDLRAEEESLQRSHGYQNSYANTGSEDRARKQSARPHFDVAHLSSKMRTIATHHKVAGTGVSEDCVNYLALALRARLQDLVTAMIHAAKHRTSAKFDKPASVYDDGTAAWGIMVRSDVAKQLAALEIADREEEERERELRERREQAIDKVLTAALQGEDIPLEMPTEEQVWQERKRRRKTQEIQQKMTNQTANKAAGVPTRIWMTTAHINKGKAPVAAPTPPLPERKYQAVRPESVPQPDGKTVVSMRDAMFVISRERGHGGGRGAALGWA